MSTTIPGGQAEDVYIFHEKQVAALCGQHCLNNLLQGSYFTAAGLAAIAQDLDDEEARLLQRHGGAASGSLSGDNSGAASPFVSSNVDDSGNFSISVLQQALSMSFGLNMERVSSGSPVLSQICRGSAGAFVANFQSHWFPLSRLTADPKRRWFNLDSTNKRPEIVGDFYLEAFIGQLLRQGYSLFQVSGVFPAPMRPSSADEAHADASWHSLQSIVAPKRPAQQHQQSNEDMMLQFALQQSLAESQALETAAATHEHVGSGGAPSQADTLVVDEDSDSDVSMNGGESPTQLALRMSLRGVDDDDCDDVLSVDDAGDEETPGSGAADDVVNLT